MLETVELRKVFKGKPAVDGVSLYMDQGEAVGLLGPNGAGKSTTISMISSLVKPTSGDVMWHGKSVVKDPTGIRKVLGVVPQEIALYEELSAYENLWFFGKMYDLRKSALKTRIQEMLALVGLEDRQKDVVRTYSGGMKRRLNIAVALLHQPEIIILDEPTLGIDPQSRNHILEMVRQLNHEKGLSVFYTSHYMEEVERLCDRVYIMDHGRIIASGTNDELKTILSGEETIWISLDHPNQQFFSALQAHPGIRQVSESEKGLKLIVPRHSQLLGSIFQAAEQYGVQILNVLVETPNLEDVFLHLTGRKLRD